MKKLLSYFILSLSLMPLTSRAQELLKDIDITVTIAADGSARIEETRDMYISSEGSECYVSLKNLNGMTISDVVVSDETGVTYETLRDWNPRALRTEKTAKCGLLKTEDGYELCWGKGNPGKHQYHVAYTLHGLVRHYSDADGFNHQFVVRYPSIPPQHVRLQLRLADGKPLNEQISGVWAFGYEGEAVFKNGSIVAESSKPFDEESTMILLVRFNHGVLTPAVEGEGTFEELKAKAIENSDYEKTFLQKWGWLLGVLVIPAILLIYRFLYYIELFLKYLWYLISLRPLRRWLKRKKMTSGLAHSRELPFNGSIYDSKLVMNSLSASYSNDVEDAVGAYLLRLFYRGDLRLLQNGEIAIGPWKGEPVSKDAKGRPAPFKKPDSRMEYTLYLLFFHAAGEDGVLQVGELRDYLVNRSGYGSVETLNGLRRSHPTKSLRQNGVQRVYGLRKFLQDYSLVSERGIPEVQLWREYLVFATLFGMADQVRSDFKRYCPEYFRMDAMADSLLPRMVELSSAAVAIADHTDRYDRWERKRNVTRGTSSSYSRSSGGGGRSSRSGGGGHSGGGTGGTR